MQVSSKWDRSSCTTNKNVLCIFYVLRSVSAVRGQIMRNAISSPPCLESQEAQKSPFGNLPAMIGSLRISGAKINIPDHSLH